MCWSPRILIGQNLTPLILWICYVSLTLDVSPSPLKNTLSDTHNMSIVKCFSITLDTFNHNYKGGQVSVLCGQKQLKISIFYLKPNVLLLDPDPPTFEVFDVLIWSTLNIKCIYRHLHIHFLIHGFFESITCQRKGRKTRELGILLTCSCFLILPHYKKLLVVKEETAFPWDSPWGAATLEKLLICHSARPVWHENLTIGKSIN